MKLFIAGATGVLGRSIIRQAVEQGHSVVGLTRSGTGAQTLSELGAEPRQASLFDADALAAAADGCDVVVHAATSIPVKARTKPADWAMNDRIRREGTEALAACAARVGARVYLQQSICWVARPPDDAPFDEDTPVTPDPRIQSAYDGENIARAAGEKHGFAVGVLRCGWFYGPDAGHTRFMAGGLRKRTLPIIGRGDARWSYLHTEDAGAAFVTAAEHGHSGLWHIVDDEPAPVGDWLTTFAALMDAPKPRHVPQWVARIFAGAAAVDFMTRPVVTHHKRFTDATGWQPRFPTYREGLAQVVGAWNQ